MLERREEWVKAVELIPRISWETDLEEEAQLLWRTLDRTPRMKERLAREAFGFYFLLFSKIYIRRSNHKLSLFWLYPLTTSHSGKEMLQTLHMRTDFRNSTAHKWCEKELLTWTKQDPGRGTVQCNRSAWPNVLSGIRAAPICTTTPFLGMGTQAFISSEEALISIMGNCTTGMSRIVCVYSSCIYAVSWLTTHSSLTPRSPHLPV